MDIYFGSINFESPKRRTERRHMLRRNEERWKMPRAAPRQAISAPTLVLFVGMSVALSACSAGAKSRVETVLRSAPGSDGKIVARIPEGSPVKVSGCAHGWCQVSWQGQKGYALAKDFIVAAPAGRATETDADNDEFKDDSEGSGD
jgi:uncharacterized protein YraI